MSALTPWKLATLRVLDRKPWPVPVSRIGGNSSHVTRALREMSESGLVARTIHDEWYVTGRGREAINADDRCIACGGEGQVRLAPTEDWEPCVACNPGEGGVSQ